MTRLITDWVWECDADGVLTYVSERIIERLGKHPVQVVGTRLSDIGTFPDLSDGVSPDFKRPSRGIAFIANGEDGTQRHFVLSALPRFDDENGNYIGATGIARDDTDLVRVEKANIRLADAIEVLSEYFALYDENDKLVISNARFRELNKEFGEAARPGGQFADLLEKEIAAGRYQDAKDNPNEWKTRRMEMRQNASSAFEVQMAGETWHLVEEARLPDGGTVMMARDISDIKHAMEALKRSAHRHRNFASDIAHKLRTPLAVLRSNLDTLGNEDEVRSLKREVDGLARMVEQLLTMTRYDNMTVFKDMSADLREIAIQVVASLAPTAIKEGREVELSGADVPILVNGDAGAIEYAIRNLIENAIKYSSRGSTVRVVLDAALPSVTVIDQGRGIPLDERARLFERFSRFDRRGYGAGLGLSIVKSIADAHHAEIIVSSDPEKGSEFTLVLMPFDQTRAKAVEL